MKGAQGWAAFGIKSLARGLNVRRGMMAAKCVALGGEWMAGATSWGRMMWHIRNREGSKRGDEIRRELGGQNPRTERFT